MDSEKMVYRQEIIERMVNALYRGRGLQAVVDLGTELLGNPIAISDTSGKKMAASVSIPSVDEQFKYNMTVGYVDDETFEILKKHKIHDQVIQSEIPVVFSPEHNAAFNTEFTYGCIISAIRINRVVVAFMSVYGQLKPFAEKDTEDVFLLTKFVSIELQKNKYFIQSHGVMYESLLIDLLEHKFNDELIVRRRLKNLGVTLKKDLYVLVTAPFGEGEREQLPQGAQAALRQYVKNCISVNYAQRIVLLAYREKGESVFSEANDSLLMYLERNQLKLGISNCFTNIIQMSVYYEQAMKGLEYGAKVSDHTILYYKDSSIYHALEICSARMQLRELCLPGILHLYESGEPEAKEMLLTLYYYLIYMKDATKIAEKLHIHKNTLFYRMGKIRQQLGISLDDGESMFQALFSYKLIEFVDGFDVDYDYEKE